MSAETEQTTSALVPLPHRQAALAQVEDFIEQLRWSTDRTLIHGFATAAIAAAGALHLAGIIDQARYDDVVANVNFAKRLAQPLDPYRADPHE